jgi:hypothetical protein
MPAEASVLGAGSPLTLSAFHDKWYQDVRPPDIGSILENGAEWYVDRAEGRLRWSLSGRPLYVLGTREDLSGFVSVPRLLLEDQQVVLCTARVRPQVEEVLRQSCDAVPTPMSADDGLPNGWLAYYRLTPNRTIPASATPDILDALRPSPDLEIVLRGGVRLHYTEWLAGYPPRIRLQGDVQHARQVTIDGKAAVQEADGTFTVSGWDLVGDHRVVCEGMSKTYSIIEAEEGWQEWSAHRFPQFPAICGALVLGAPPGDVNLPDELVDKEPELPIDDVAGLPWGVEPFCKLLIGRKGAITRLIADLRRLASTAPRHCRAGLQQAAENLSHRPEAGLVWLCVCILDSKMIPRPKWLDDFKLPPAAMKDLAKTQRQVDKWWAGPSATH